MLTTTLDPSTQVSVRTEGCDGVDTRVGVSEVSRKKNDLIKVVSCYTLKINQLIGHIFGGQNFRRTKFSAGKDFRRTTFSEESCLVGIIFSSNPNFRHFCPPKCCPIRYYSKGDLGLNVGFLILKNISLNLRFQWTTIQIYKERGMCLKCKNIVIKICQSYSEECCFLLPAKITMAVFIHKTN